MRGIGFRDWKACWCYTHDRVPVHTLVASSIRSQAYLTYPPSPESKCFGHTRRQPISADIADFDFYKDPV